MTPKEVMSLFPLEIEITDEHRESANYLGGIHRLGKVLLKEKFPDEDVFWGLSIGTVNGVNIKTEMTENYRGKMYKVPLYMDSNFKGNKIKFELR